MTTCLRASLLLVTTAVKVAMLVGLGLAVGVVVAPVVVTGGAASHTSVGWAARLDDAFGGRTAEPDVARWTDPTYLRSQWTALRGLLDG